MKSKPSLTRALRVSALIILGSGFFVWTATGARLGWTQTSAVTMQHDEVTGIDFPVRGNVFVAGIEIPLVTTVFAAIAASVSILLQRRWVSTTA